MTSGRPQGSRAAGLATGIDVRRACRAGSHTGATAHLAPGMAQANLVILPAEHADAFAAYCAANPKPCPLLERLPVGTFLPRAFAHGADVRCDLPRYRIFEGAASRDVHRLEALPGEAVVFLLGCSFSFEAGLADAGIPSRHVVLGTNVPMYRTTRSTTPVGPFSGPLVVSMRPVPAAEVEVAYEATRPFSVAHGEPVHAGNAAALGIHDLAAPEWGDAVPVLEEEVPLFWACGVTSQEAVAGAVARGDVAWAVTHAPGCMLVGDVSTDALRGWKAP